MTSLLFLCCALFKSIPTSTLLAFSSFYLLWTKGKICQITSTFFPYCYLLANQRMLLLIINYFIEPTRHYALHWVYRFLYVINISFKSSTYPYFVETIIMVGLNFPQLQGEHEFISFTNLPIPSFVLLMLWERLLSQVNQWPQWMVKVSVTQLFSQCW